MLLSISEFIGRFHPLVVHLPIGILLLAVLLQWLSRKEKYKLPPAVTRVTWWLGIISALIACITGYMLSLSEDYEEGAVTIHMWMGIAVAAASLYVASKIFLKQFDLIYKISSVALVLAIFGAGHFGGSLTHGSDYLFSAWDFDSDSVIAIKPVPDIQEAYLYKDVVEPMLNARCYSCHSKQKQKGKLRLDSPDFILKGGKNGDVIEPGNIEESELIKRLLLPKLDEDHMPPKEKPQLNKNQVALLQWWVETGCVFDKKVKELEQTAPVKTMLAALEKPTPVEKQATIILPEKPVAAADANDMEALKQKGIVVMPVALNTNYLMVSFVTAANLGDRELKMLLPLKNQLLVLKLNDTHISDTALEVVSQLRQLITLQLNNTKITDKGLVKLRALEQLQTLNLVNTQVSLQGLAQLQPLKKLEQLYLYKTKVNANEYSVLKKVFPNTRIDTGGYRLKTLASDTVVLTKPIAP